MTFCCNFALFVCLFSYAEEDLDDVMFGKTTRHRPEELKSLERSTKFTRKEIQLIYRGFKQVLFVIYFLSNVYLILGLPSFICARMISLSYSAHFLSFCVNPEDALRDASLRKMIFPFFRQRGYFLFAFRGVSVEGVREESSFLSS